ncbi:MAG: hypothetical protein V7K27_21585 [Nostoc sp.]|uniref:hypothetical protein n=1 Tax=Nostoc sp. TaxID=1180 RepID=UPI002FF964F1
MKFQKREWVDITHLTSDRSSIGNKCRGLAMRFTPTPEPLVGEDITYYNVIK